MVSLNFQTKVGWRICEQLSAFAVALHALMKRNDNSRAAIGPDLRSHFQCGRWQVRIKSGFENLVRTPGRARKMRRFRLYP